VASSSILLSGLKLATNCLNAPFLIPRGPKPSHLGNARCSLESRIFRTKQPFDSQMFNVHKPNQMDQETVKTLGDCDYRWRPRL
jgi:hypothetical protein